MHICSINKAHKEGSRSLELVFCLEPKSRVQLYDLFPRQGVQPCAIHQPGSAAARPFTPTLAHPSITPTEHRPFIQVRFNTASLCRAIRT